MDDAKRVWRREGNRPWYWRRTLDFLADLPDRSELISEVFRRHAGTDLGAKRMALDHLSWLVEVEEVAGDASVADAIATIKRLHRGGNTHAEP